MRPSLLRIVSLVLLVATLCVFTGLTAQAAGGTVAVAADSCCDRDAGRADAPADEEGIPCQSAECPCLSCLALLIPEAVTVRTLSAEGAFPAPSASVSPPAPFVASIDYPPEAV